MTGCCTSFVLHCIFLNWVFSESEINSTISQIASQPMCTLMASGCTTPSCNSFLTVCGTHENVFWGSFYIELFFCFLLFVEPLLIHWARTHEKSAGPQSTDFPTPAPVVTIHWLLGTKQSNNKTIVTMSFCFAQCLYDTRYRKHVTPLSTTPSGTRG